MTNFSFQGTYTCIAKGSKGSVEAETKVDVTGDDDPDNHGKGRDDLDWIDDPEEDDYNLWWDPEEGMYLNSQNPNTLVSYFWEVIVNGSVAIVSKSFTFSLQLGISWLARTVSPRFFFRIFFF